jgi:hypothetical protein
MNIFTLLSTRFRRSPPDRAKCTRCKKPDAKGTLRHTLVITGCSVHGYPWYAVLLRTCATFLETQLLYNDFPEFIIHFESESHEPVKFIDRL